MSTTARTKSGPTPTAPDPPALPLTAHRARETPDLSTFETALQHLIHRFMQTYSPEQEVSGLQRVFASLSKELGRVDGALRLHGMTREETLRLLRDGMIDGKGVTLTQHKKCCTCEAAKVLQDEIEVN